MGGLPLPKTRQLPDIIFILSAIAAIVAILYFGRHMWFYSDDWYMLADRDVTVFSDWVRPQNKNHWTLLPMLVFSGIYSIVGIHSYTPYQIPLILFHLITAILLRRVMLRAKADPWLVTAAVILFLFYGTSRPNLVWAFQISLVGSLMFGLLHLEYVLRQRQTGWTYGLGMFCGALSLMCSALGIPMVMMVSLAVLMLHGLRRALLNALPLALFFLSWWFIFPKPGGAMNFDPGGPLLWLSFIEHGISAAIRGLGQFKTVSICLALIWVAGGFIAFGTRSAGSVGRLQFTTYCVSVSGALLFLLFAAIGRVASAKGPLGLVTGSVLSAESARYLYVIAALLLPSLVLAADLVARKLRFAPAFLVPLFMFGLPGNINALAKPKGIVYNNDFQEENRRVVLAALESPAFATAPDDMLVVPHSQVVTLGWLRHARDSGKVPRLDDLDTRHVDRATAMMSLALATSHGEDCRPVKIDSVIGLDQGDSLSFHVAGEPPVEVHYLPSDGGEPVKIRFPMTLGVSALATYGPIDVRVMPDPQLSGVSHCTGGSPERWYYDEGW